MTVTVEEQRPLGAGGGGYWSVSTGTEPQTARLPRGAGHHLAVGDTLEVRPIRLDAASVL